MIFTFYKYQGTGNDFVVLDNRSNTFLKKKQIIAHLCDRRLGVGGDGLMLLQNKSGYDFEMVYFNADGNPSSFCGNGSRCLTHFANHLGLIKNNKVSFFASDGEHEAGIKNGVIRVRMRDVKSIENQLGSYILNTGSPHYVKFIKNLSAKNMVSVGRKIRYSTKYKKEGVNVNYAEQIGKTILVRTYERGVEGETLSCGTGVTATALVAAVKGISTAINFCKISTLGGILTVHFEREKKSFKNIWLEGSAELVYTGEISI